MTTNLDAGDEKAARHIADAVKTDDGKEVGSKLADAYFAMGKDGNKFGEFLNQVKADNADDLKTDSHLPGFEYGPDGSGNLRVNVTTLLPVWGGLLPRDREEVFADIKSHSVNDNYFVGSEMRNQNETAIADTNSVVRAVNKVHVIAEAGSSVDARGNAQVYAEAGASVVAHDHSQVTAVAGSSVEALDDSQVTANPGSSVEAYNGSQVTAKKDSSVHAFDYSHVTVECGAIFQVTGNDAKVTVPVESDLIIIDDTVEIGKPATSLDTSLESAPKKQPCVFIPTEIKDAP